MFQARIYKAVFSFEQPEAILDTLLPILRQSQELPDFKSSQLVFATTQTILLIDEQEERIRYLTYLLPANGYDIRVTRNAIDAFTLVLREMFIPFTILLAKERTSDRFFLTRLLQQIAQKYNWNAPCIEVQMRTIPMLPPQVAGMVATDPPTLPLESLYQASPVKRSLPGTETLVSLAPVAMEHSPVQLSPATPDAIEQSTEFPLVRLLPPSAVAASVASPISLASRPLTDSASSEPLLLSSQESRFLAIQETPTMPMVIPAITPMAVNAAPQMISSTPESVSTPSSAIVLTTSATRTPPIQLSPTKHHDAVKTATQTTHVSLKGLSIGRYHMQELLGSGPLGSVYRTYDRLREHDIVLKAVQLDIIPSYMDYQDYQDFTSESNLFQQEIDLLRSFNHPHILVPLSCNKSYISGSPFVYKTMLYCEGGSLAKWVYRVGVGYPLPVKAVARVIAQVADALQLVHNQHVTYQNFKLTNLLVREHVNDARKIHILLSDFALAQQGTFLLKTPSIFHSMAPERWQGQSLPASDQYGLAALGYELLTGHQLFSSQAEHIVRQLHMTMPPQPPSSIVAGISPAIDAVFLRALAKHPQERFPTITAFADALQKVAV